MKKLVTLGCSWTANYKNDNWTAAEVIPWPEVIKKKKNWDVINYGECGSGNWYGFTRFLEHIRTEGAPDSVYWLMTEMDRMDGVSDPNASIPITTYKRVTAGLNDNYIVEVIGQENFKKNEIDFWQMQTLRRTHKICSILGKNIDLQQIIDENLYYILQMQHVCKEFNIELKIGMALNPTDTWSLRRSGIFSDKEINQIPRMILQSRHFRKIDTSTLIGWPFAIEAGGMAMINIRNWDDQYGLHRYDNHPGQKGADLIADIFLGEKKISDYK